MSAWRLLVSLLWLGLGILPLLATGCGEDEKAKAEDDLKQLEDEPLEDPYGGAGPTRISFRDLSALKGFENVNHSGREGKKEYLIEAVGPGCAWFDYDQDGLLDVYLPDGDVFSNYDLVRLTEGGGRTRPVLTPKSPKPETFLDQLWRNNGDGTFTDVAAEAGIVDDSWSFGSTAFDYDGDGWVDVFVANFGHDRLWRNNGDGTFSDVAPEVGLQGDLHAWSTCAAVGDIDGDGRLDIFVAAYADPAAEVDRVRGQAGQELGTPVETISGRECRWRGLKVYCGPLGLAGQHDRCYRQLEDGTFLDMTDAWRMRPRVAKYGFTTAMFDFNEDGLLDVYVANDSEENFMWQQERDARGNIRFRETSDTLGIKYGTTLQPQASMGLAIADVNRDGLFDIFITNFSHDYNNIFLGHRVGGDAGTFFYKDRGLRVMGQQVYYDLSWGCGWYDFDNDIDLDLYVANGHVYKEIDLFKLTNAKYEQYNALFECMEADKMGFREIGAKAQEKPAANVNVQDLDAGDGMRISECSRGAGFADWNNDGRMDLLVLNMNVAPNLLLNTSKTGPDTNWIKVDLTQPGKNREAIGAVVEIKVGTVTQRFPVMRLTSFLGTDDPRIHLGLGAATHCDVRVIWPGVKRESTMYTGLQANRHWRLDRESGKASEVELKAFQVK